MLKLGVAVALLAAVTMAVAAQTASGDPTNAKDIFVITAICGGQEVQVTSNGNGNFTPGHDMAGTSVLVPTAVELTFSITPTGGTTETETVTRAKNSEGKNPVSCQISANLNTFTEPEGTFVISGSATGFWTPVGS